jgi:hypothetical protein
LITSGLAYGGNIKTDAGVWNHYRPIGAAVASSLDPVCENRTERLKRISYVLNIHAALRKQFQNPENVSNFMTAINHSPPFNGTTPLILIRSGNIDALKIIVSHLEALKTAF